MALNVAEKYDVAVKHLMAELPTINFVIDMVGKAVEISYAEYGDSVDFRDRLELASRLAHESRQLSEPNFYMTHLVIAPLVTGIDPNKWTVLDTASGTLKTLVGNMNEILNANGFKDRWQAIAKALKNGDPYMMVVVLHMLDLVISQILEKEPKELDAVEQLNLLGIGYIEVCLRQSGFVVDNRFRKIYNEFTNKVLHIAKF